MSGELWAIVATGITGLVASYVTYRNTKDRNQADRDIALGSVAQSTADQVYREIDLHFTRLEEDNTRLRERVEQVESAQKRCEARERKMLRALSKAGIAGFEDNGELTGGTA